MASFAANPSIVSVPRGASPTSASRQPLQRMLDRRMLSVSTFVSSNASDTPLASQTAREFRRPRSTWPDVMPEAILFPANKPTSRADAQVLARWVSSSFQTYAKRSKQADSKEICEEDLTKMVQELVPVLSIGLNEVVRQVSQHCLERGVVLEKIWRTYVELFEQALGESREALRRQKDKTAKAEAELQRVRDEATELKAKHPAQLDKLRQTLTTKFDQRQNELVQQLTSTRSENRALKVHLEEQLSKQHAWFPMFAIYKESRYRRALLGKAVAELPKAASVEARLASDFRRILSSLPADVRRRVGFFISSLLGFRGVGLSAVTSEALQERKELNAKKIKELKAKLRQLQGQDTSESSEEEEPGSQTEEANLANTCEVPDIPPATSTAPNNGADEGLVDPLAD